MIEEPTETAASLGVRVEDRPGLTADLNYNVTGATMERVRAAAIALTRGINETAEVLEGFSTPTGIQRWALEDDFTNGNERGWTIVESGGAASVTFTPAWASEASELVAEVVNEGETAGFYWPVDFVRGNHSPVFKIRMRLFAPEQMSELVVGLFGWTEGAGQAAFVLNVGNDTWVATAVALPSGVEIQTGVAIPIDEWFVLTIAFTDGSVVFSMDDAVLATVPPGPEVPTDQSMTPYVVMVKNEDAGFPNFAVDWISVRGTR